MGRALAAIGVAVGAVALVVLGSACGLASAPSRSRPRSDESSSEAALAESRRPGGFRALRRKLATDADDAGADAGSDPATSTTRFRYRGGPVIPHVRVHAVFWGTSVAYGDRLRAFYASITSSRFIDALKEYDTATTSIRRGSFAGAFVIQPHLQRSGTTIQDDDIQAELSAQIDAGNLPAPDGVNSVYMLHFPPGISIVGSDGETSCVEYCAYHDVFMKNGKAVVYGVHPDFGPQSGCQQGCGLGTSDEITTSVASHELAESITDPGPDLAWYNDRDGEIADVCNENGRVNGFVVQLVWSNAQARCALGPSAAEATP